MEIKTTAVVYDASNPLISIIVPVYNTEKYLAKCLDSLLAQTLSNIEILCINDGSTDSSAEILAKYAEMDNRIVVITQQNAGQSAARNKGLDCAHAPYIMFVDSDDYIELTTCETLYKEIESENADAVIFCNFLEYGDKMLPQFVLGKERQVYSDGACQSILSRRLIGFVGEELQYPEQQDKITPVWMKIFNADLIKRHKMRFVGNKFVGPAEDTLFNIDYFTHCQKCVYIPSVLYHYIRTNTESVTSGYREHLLEKNTCFLKCIHERIMESEYMLENKSVFEQALSNRYAISMIPLGLNAIRGNVSFRTKMQRVKVLMDRPGYRDSVKVLPLSYMPFYWKVFFTCVKFRMKTLVTILLIIIQSLRKLRNSRRIKSQNRS